MEHPNVKRSSPLVDRIRRTEAKIRYYRSPDPSPGTAPPTFAARSAATPLAQSVRWATKQDQHPDPLARPSAARPCLHYLDIHTAVLEPKPWVCPSRQRRGSRKDCCSPTLRRPSVAALATVSSIGHGCDTNAGGGLSVGRVASNGGSLTVLGRTSVNELWQPSNTQPPQGVPPTGSAMRRH